jgi:hypothetical protein
MNAATQKNKQVPAPQIKLTKQTTKLMNTQPAKPNNQKPSAPRILKVDPIKKAASIKANEDRVKAALANTNVHNGPQPEKKKKKKWYDRALDVGESVVKHLVPYLPMLLGAGDYEEGAMLATSDPPTTNTILSSLSGGRLGNDVPYMHSTGKAVRVPHREYLGDVYSSTAEFVTETFPINPGMNETFPWCSPIANQFTDYKIAGIAAEFNSLGSEYSNVAGLGYVALGTQYNNDEPTFPNKRDMLNSVFSDAAKPSTSFCSFIECAEDVIPLGSRKMVRGGDVSDGVDLNLYDHGKLTLAVGGNTEDDVAIGELWLTYDIELFLPRPKESANNLYSSYFCSGVTNLLPLGTAFNKRDDSTFGLSLDGTSISFPDNIRGEFMVQLFWVAPVAIVGSSVPAITGVNCTVSDPNPPSVGSGSTGGSTTNGRLKTVIIKRDGAKLSVATTGNIASGSTAVVVYVFNIPSQYGGSKPIFDYKGKNRTEKYNNFMNKFKTEMKPGWTSNLFTENFVIESKEFKGDIKFRFYHNKDSNECFPIRENIVRLLRVSTNADKILFSLYNSFIGENNPELFPKHTSVYQY